MTGDVMGKPVEYEMTASRALHGTFTEMHMWDVNVPSEYEARVFIGYDADSKTVIVHWMDSFGARFSIPHGSGQLSENTIQFVVPYKESHFRDTLGYNPSNRTWIFAIESAQPDGTWKHFARYVLRPR